MYGGVGYEKQKKALRRGVEILVACPGRLADLDGAARGRLDASRSSSIDEADRMADMGFLPEVRRILDATAADRQTVLFSATLDGDVAVLQRHYQRRRGHARGRRTAEQADIEHHFEEVEIGRRVVARPPRSSREHGSTIVFTPHPSRRRTAGEAAEQAGVDAAPIHGGLSQAKRDRRSAGFKGDKVEALIATDVAARGIHVDAVACVVHFDPPVDAKTYVHRSGRTARAGATGTVVSFVARDQRAASRKLRRTSGMLPASTGRSMTTPTNERRPTGDVEAGATSSRPVGQRCVDMSALTFRDGAYFCTGCDQKLQIPPARSVRHSYTTVQDGQRERVLFVDGRETHRCIDQNAEGLSSLPQSTCRR